MRKILIVLVSFVSLNSMAQEANKTIAPGNTEVNPDGVKKVTFVERLGLKNSTVGQVVYDVSVGAYYVYSGSQWVLSRTLSPTNGVPMMNAGVATNAPSFTVNGNGVFVGSASGPTGNTVTFDLATNPSLFLRVPNASATTSGIAKTSANAGKIGIDASNILSLNASSVTSTFLADNSVTSAKIANGSVASLDLADGAVTAAKLGLGAVTPAKIALGAANQILRTSANGTTVEWADAPAGGGGGSGFLGTYTAVNRATSDAVKDSLNLNNGTPADVNITGLFGQAIAATDQLSSVGLSFANNTYTNNSGATVYVRVSTNITFRRNYIDNAERLVWLEYLPNGGSGVTVARANSKGVVLANQTLSLSGVTLKLANGDGFAIKARSAGGDATNPVFVGGLSAVDNLTIDRVK